MLNTYLRTLSYNFYKNITSQNLLPSINPQTMTFHASLENVIYKPESEQEKEQLNPAFLSFFLLLCFWTLLSNTWGIRREGELTKPEKSKEEHCHIHTCTH